MNPFQAKVWEKCWIKYSMHFKNCFSLVQSNGWCSGQCSLWFIISECGTGLSSSLTVNGSTILKRGLIISLWSFCSSFCWHFAYTFKPGYNEPWCNEIRNVTSYFQIPNVASTSFEMTWCNERNIPSTFCMEVLLHFVWNVWYLSDKLAVFPISLSMVHFYSTFIPSMFCIWRLIRILLLIMQMFNKGF